jgi:hypothetical protein
MFIDQRIGEGGAFRQEHHTSARRSPFRVKSGRSRRPRSYQALGPLNPKERTRGHGRGPDCRQQECDPAVASEVTPLRSIRLA